MDANSLLTGDQLTDSQLRQSSKWLSDSGQRAAK